MNEKKWLVHEDGIDEGPYSDAELKRLARDSMITAKTQISPIVDRSKPFEASRLKGLKFGDSNGPSEELSKENAELPNSGTQPKEKLEKRLLLLGVDWTGFSTLQKYALGAVGLAFVIVYATGHIWTIVRFAVSAVAVVTLILTGYFGWQYYIASRNPPETPDLSRNPLRSLIAMAVFTVIVLIVLGLIPSANVKNPNDRTTRGQVNDSSSTVISRSENSTSSSGTKQTNGEIGSQSGRSQTTNNENQAAAEFLGALFGAAAEQQRREQNDPRYRGLQQAIENANRCGRCGGAGTYRFVDGNGVLQSRTCPTCLGSGKGF